MTDRVILSSIPDHVFRLHPDAWILDRYRELGISLDEIRAERELREKAGRI